MTDSNRATHSPVITWSSENQYRLRPSVDASSDEAIRSPGSRVCCRISSDPLFWSARGLPPRWPRLNGASSDGAPVTLAELSTLKARMRRLPATSTHFHSQAACQGRAAVDHDLEQGVTIFPRFGAPGDLHRRNAAILFSAPFPRVEVCSQMLEAMEKKSSQGSKGLHGLSRNTMISIGIFNWTSLGLMAIVIWCNATM